jgi:putative ABC transport system permease protein
MKSLNKATDIMLLGFSSLNVHKVRSFLTSLSIIFGVGCVIASLAINAGASSEAQKSLRELGSDNIIINAVKPPEDPTAKGGFGTFRYGITKNDVVRLRDNIPNVKKCVIVHRTKKHALANKRRMAVSIIATEPTYAEVARVDLQSGRFFHAKDMLRYKTHCILTYSLARQMFGHNDPMGKFVCLGGTDFRVIGVLKRLPRALAGDGSGADRQVLIPLSTDEVAFGTVTRIGTQGSYVVEEVAVHQVILNMKDEQAVLDGAQVARSLLQRFHERPDYQVVVPIEEIEIKKQQKRLWNIVMLLIAGVSLLVGGIGIMNIMLASVTERTREIGIRRALGAKRGDITVQFLVEAVTLTMVGGLLGIALGLTTPLLIEKFLGFPGLLTPSMLWLPFGVAVLVGLLSGIYPATRAAMLDPIDALRHE